MKTKITLLILAFGLIVTAFSQKSTMELTFTAGYNGQYVPLDSILIENLTQGGDTTLYTPDTVLVLDFFTSIGNIEAIGETSFSVSQNYPNPIQGKTTIDVYLSDEDNINITVRDILGRKLVKNTYMLKRGTHSFDFYAGSEKFYLFTVTGKQTRKTIKMVNANIITTNSVKCKIVYNEYEDNPIGFKSKEAINNFVFVPGDELRYTGFANTLNEVNGSDVIEDAPQTNEIYEFEILEGIPCPGIPEVLYDGQIYTTVLIGDQCWMKENMNAGVMINGIDDMIDNEFIEKWCYEDDTSNCDTYGALYQWGETMQYSTIEGAKGICPDGWHIPTDEEYKILEGKVDSQYNYPDPEWDTTWFRGFDAGLNLKSTSNWNSNGNGSDLYGFRGLPGGYRNMWGGFGAMGEDGYFYTSTIGIQISDVSFARGLHGITDESGRWELFWPQGQSVRCLKD